VVSFTRSRYWVPRIKNLVKPVINSYRVCVIHKKRWQVQMMGSFSKELVPITKGYVLVFICFSTKAIHPT